MRLSLDLQGVVMLLLGLAMGAGLVRIVSCGDFAGTPAQVMYWVESAEQAREQAFERGPASKPERVEIVRVVRDTVRVEVCEQVPEAYADTMRGKLAAQVGLVHLGGGALRVTPREARLLAWNPSADAFIVETYRIPEQIRLHAFAGLAIGDGPEAGLSLDYRRLGAYIGLNARGLRFGLRVRIF